jgi:hypothetical protein
MVCTKYVPSTNKDLYSNEFLYKSSSDSVNLFCSSSFMVGMKPPSTAWSLVSNVGRLPCAATRSRHAVAGQGSNLDFAVAKLGSLGFEALLGRCNVETYST